MTVEIPLVNSEYILQKFPGKGGWTYAEIPEVLQNRNKPFGWVKVKGAIDDCEIRNYKLMPMGNGKLFLPLKASIRKKIGKEVGDSVRIVLYNDETPLEIPNEILECFNNEPTTSFDIFQSFTEGEQKAYLDWIYSAKTDSTKALRILKMMDRIQQNLKFSDKSE